MQHFIGRRPVVAIDLPGNGESEHLITGDKDLLQLVDENTLVVVDVEKFIPPLTVKKLPLFKENHVDSAIILRDIDEPFCLSVSILGMVSPIKDLDSVRTVNEFLEEMDKQDGK